MKVRRAHHLVAEAVVFLLRTVHPMDRDSGLRELGHLLHPPEKVLVLAQWRRNVVALICYRCSGHEGEKFSLAINIYKYSIFRIYYIQMSDALRQFKSEIFQALANPTRIAIVELLRDGELSAGQLIDKLGIEQANASQHLAVLRSKQIVVNRKVGNQVFYSIRDHALIEVLDILRRYFYSQLNSTVRMLKEAARQQPKTRISTPR